MIQTIPKTFRRNGFDFKLIKRGGMVAIYSLSKKKDIYGYEVHKLRTRPARERKYRKPDGKVNIITNPEEERLAGNEDFGRYGWSFQEKTSAMNKYRELLKGAIGD